MDPTWYFSDAYYSRNKNGWDYSWPNPDYPYDVNIHHDDLRIYSCRKIAIRKWIEDKAYGIIIHELVDKSYRIWYSPKDRKWDKNFIDIDNKWDVFYFSKEEDRLAFILFFSEYIKPISDKHPTKHWDPESEE